jgi:hypothetical protein
MGSDVTFLDCPAYLDAGGSLRCRLPAHVECRYIMDSTDGPLESAMIRCPAGHFFSGPIEYLTFDKPLPAARPTMTGQGTMASPRNERR